MVLDKIGLQTVLMDLSLRRPFMPNPRLLGGRRRRRRILILLN
jgi:hypothetical protein